MEKWTLKDRERIDDLQLNGLRIIQNRDGFCFGMDAVLLSDFAKPKRSANILDIGTGTGILAILLSAKTSARSIMGIDIMPDVVEMAQRSVRLNQLEELIEIRCMDLKQAPELLGKSRFDYIVCNPPYTRQQGGAASKTQIKATARHELTCTLEDIIIACAMLLNDQGKAAFILPSGRLFELMLLMHQYGIEPKRVRMIQAYADRAPKLVCVEGMKGAKPHIQWEAPLLLYDADGSESQEVRRIYHRGEL